MQARGATLAPGFLFDSDMGRNIDAAIALAMLYGLGRGRVVGVGVNSSTLDAAAFCDVLARFYNLAPTLPIALPEDGPKLGDSPMLRVPLAMELPSGQPVFRPAIRSIIDTGDPPVVFRNALLTQQEKQAIVVLAGPATNLARLLALSGAKEIIAARSQLLVMAAGAFEKTSIDLRIQADPASAKKVLAEWPAPIVAVGIEAGVAAPYPDEAVEASLASIPNHPVVAAYRAYRETQPAGSGVPSQAILAALYAANSSADYFRLSPAGTIEIGVDGRTSFRETNNGTHRYLVVNADQKERITQAFVGMSAARPSTGGRGGPPRNE
jgi:inosine-uridine nucleoside N-ribohydrolase